MKKNIRMLSVVASGIAALVWAAAFEPHAAGQAPPGFVAGTESGFATFQTQCAQCHGNPNVDRAPTPEALREMLPEKIYAALTTGVMQQQASALTDPQKKAVAEFMAGRPLGSAKSGGSETMGFQCRANPPLPDPASRPAWNGWSPDLANTRFQPASVARLTPAQVPKLKLKWAFGFPSGVSANAQPSVVSGGVFVGSDNGYVYSIDAKSGCVYWSFETGSIIRNAITVGAVKGNGDAKYAAFVGDGHANVFAINAQNGTLLWKTKVDPHFVARITAGTRYYDGKLIVPVSSSEEFSSGNPGYSCCTSRGSVVALDANTGRQIWKAWVIPDEPKPYKTMSNGVVLYAPAGGAVWNSPTIDPIKRAVYFGTGEPTT